MLTRTQYERLIYTLPSRHPSIRLSTLVLVPPGLDVARLTGLVAFGDDCVLCVYELLNFGQGIIEATPLRSIAVSPSLYRKPTTGGRRILPRQLPGQGQTVLVRFVASPQ